ncbi:MAG: hypothetical protein Q9224_001687 [Gallowayella concinna]
MTPSECLNEAFLAHWALLNPFQAGSCVIKAVNGHSLDIATVVLVARYHASVGVSDDAYHAIDQSATALESKIATGEVIYGINTGFGGSADTRTKAVDKLKEDLLSGLQYGIIAETATTDPAHSQEEGSEEVGLSVPSLPLRHEIDTVMPESWVRASLLIRVNSLAHGVSGIMPPTVDALLRLLNCNLTPRVPLHGSISASGDLSPLAYIAGVLEGKPSLSVYVGAQRRVERADIGLSRHSITPLVLTAREGLALVNGTSVSAAVAALAMHEALSLAVLSQILTAMSVEALRGTDESFDPFLARVRPHWGQAEASRNIFSMLNGSKLVDRGHGSNVSSLRQDRYSLRTASQWLGPALEDLSLAHSQIVMELNSATDNPLIDAGVSPPRLLHGGNFQAKAITSAVEKIRQSVQSIGRILFSQCTELINPATSRGLPPNLVASEPSESFIFKGTDILVASLLSELGFLSNPVASHVQTAEMGNQGINSLALISARYTLDALDILSQLAAAHLVALCQALDLRVLRIRFLASLESSFRTSIEQGIGQHLSNPEILDTLLDTCWKAFTVRLDATTSMDSAVRLPGAIVHLQPLILPFLLPSAEALKALRSCTEDLGKSSLDSFIKMQQLYVREGEATNMLGQASKQMYTYIRKDLGIPFVGPETLATPSVPEQSGVGVTMGALNGRVKAAMAEGKLYTVVAECLRDVEKENRSKPTLLAKL